MIYAILNSISASIATDPYLTASIAAGTLSVNKWDYDLNTQVSNELNPVYPLAITVKFCDINRLTFETYLTNGPNDYELDGQVEVVENTMLNRASGSFLAGLKLAEHVFGRLENTPLSGSDTIENFLKVTSTSLINNSNNYKNATKNELISYIVNFKVSGPIYAK